MSNEKKKAVPKKVYRKRWSAEEKIRVVLAAGGLDDEKLGEFLRREGLHEADLQQFRKEVEQAATEGLSAPKRSQGISPEQKRIRQLEKELARKEKALAETAALLVLQKKVQDYFSAEEDGDTNESNEK